ncbi:hypothetical protein H1Q78_09855 [Cellulosimicrobium cellulans]|nr:hypothetical protein H1Q78_09855 [Cellulosimicrobium cellulans]
MVDGAPPGGELARAWERLGAAGTDLLLVLDDAARVPAWCRTVVDVAGPTVVVTGPDDARTVREHVGASEEWAVALARRLAAADHLGRLDGTDPAGHDPGDPTSPSLPADVALGDLLGLPGEPDELTAWVDAHWRDAAQRDGTGLRAALGVGAGGAPVTVDLVRDGPHVLVAGTTGAGKSELLQTLVTGLALGRSPAELSIALVDFKGGASFGACGLLPHVVGTVTDLDPGLAGRALAGLRSELRRRERVLATAGATSVDELPRGRLPRLVVVVDEFRALADDLPDLLPGLLRVAAQGRSLGVHLVLATQRPAGAVSADVRANITLRLALRVVDAADSRDVVESPLAALVPASAPGRLVLRRGAEPPLAVQGRAGAAGARLGVGCALGSPVGRRTRPPPRSLPRPRRPRARHGSTPARRRPAPRGRGGGPRRRRACRPAPGAAAVAACPARPGRAGRARGPRARGRRRGARRQAPRRARYRRRAGRPCAPRRRSGRCRGRHGARRSRGATRRARRRPRPATPDRRPVGPPRRAPRRAGPRTLGADDGAADRRTGRARARVGGPRRRLGARRPRVPSRDGDDRRPRRPASARPPPAAARRSRRRPGASREDRRHRPRPPARGRRRRRPVGPRGRGGRCRRRRARGRAHRPRRGRHGVRRPDGRGAVVAGRGARGHGVARPSRRRGAGRALRARRTGRPGGACRVARSRRAGPVPARSLSRRRRSTLRGGRLPATDGPGTPDRDAPPGAFRLAPLPARVAPADLTTPDPLRASTGPGTGPTGPGLEPAGSRLASAALHVPVGRGGDTAVTVTLDVSGGALVVGPPGSGRTSALTLLARHVARAGTLRAVVARDDALAAAAGPGTDVVRRYAPADVGALLDAATAGMRETGREDSRENGPRGLPGVVVVDDLDVLVQLCMVEGERLAAACRDGLVLLASATTGGAASALRGPLADLRGVRAGIVLAPGERGSTEVFGRGLEWLAEPGRPRPGRGVLVQGARLTPVQLALPSAGGCSSRTSA